MTIPRHDTTSSPESGPALAEPIVILSDLHVAHPLSLVRTPAQIAPLLPENGTVIFNGDSVEMRSHLDRGDGAARRDALAALCSASGNRAIFLTGNHDPFVSDTDHLDLFKRRVLVTHGDFLFHEVSPWSHEGHLIGAEHTRLLDTLTAEEQGDFPTRLRVAKQASRVLENFYTARQSPVSVLRNILLEFIPPWRPLQVLKYWNAAPDKAAAIAREFRPEAKFIVVGHLHHAGVWHRNDRTIINTGCYFPMVGRRMVRIADGRLEVRQIRGLLGSFTPGPVVFEAPLG